MIVAIKSSRNNKLCLQSGFGVFKSLSAGMSTSAAYSSKKKKPVQSCSVSTKSYLGKEC